MRQILDRHWASYWATYWATYWAGHLIRTLAFLGALESASWALDASAASAPANSNAAVASDFDRLSGQLADKKVVAQLTTRDGVQIYTCAKFKCVTDAADPSKQSCTNLSDLPANQRPPDSQIVKKWDLKAARARLVDDHHEVGTHYFIVNKETGKLIPAWDLDDDGSHLTGKKLAVKPNSAGVPLLVLRAENNGGRGLFKNVTDIERLDTLNGVPPDPTCATLGTELRVPYSATYKFYNAGVALPGPGAPTAAAVGAGSSLKPTVVSH